MLYRRTGALCSGHFENSFGLRHGHGPSLTEGLCALQDVLPVEATDVVADEEIRIFGTNDLCKAQQQLALARTAYDVGILAALLVRIGRLVETEENISFPLLRTKKCPKGKANGDHSVRVQLR